MRYHETHYYYPTPRHLHSRNHCLDHPGLWLPDRRNKDRHRRVGSDHVHRFWQLDITKLLRMEVGEMMAFDEPTYCQKKLIASRGLVVNDWLVYRENPSDLTIVHRYTGEIKILQ